MLLLGGTSVMNNASGIDINMGAPLRLEPGTCALSLAAVDPCAPCAHS